MWNHIPCSEGYCIGVVCTLKYIQVQSTFCMLKYKSLYTGEPVSNSLYWNQDAEPKLTLLSFENLKEATVGLRYSSSLGGINLAYLVLLHIFSPKAVTENLIVIKHITHFSFVVNLCIL